MVNAYIFTSFSTLMFSNVVLVWYRCSMLCFFWDSDVLFLCDWCSMLLVLFDIDVQCCFCRTYILLVLCEIHIRYLFCFCDICLMCVMLFMWCSLVRFMWHILFFVQHTTFIFVRCTHEFQGWVTWIVELGKDRKETYNNWCFLRLLMF